MAQEAGLISVPQMNVLIFTVLKGRKITLTTKKARIFFFWGKIGEF